MPNIEKSSCGCGGNANVRPALPFGVNGRIGGRIGGRGVNGRVGGRGVNGRGINSRINNRLKPILQ